MCLAGYVKDKSYANLHSYLFLLLLRKLISVSLHWSALHNWLMSCGGCTFRSAPGEKIR